MTKKDEEYFDRLEDKHSDLLSRYTPRGRARMMKHLEEWDSKRKLEKYKIIGSRKSRSREICTEIIFQLDSGPKGFKELKEYLGLTSPSFLSRCIKRLMIADLIVRDPESRKYRLKEEVPLRRPKKDYFRPLGLTQREARLLDQTPMPSEYFFEHALSTRVGKIVEKVAVHFYPKLGMRRVDIPEHIQPKFESVLKRLFLPLYSSLFPRGKKNLPRQDFNFDIMINVEGAKTAAHVKTAQGPIEHSMYPRLLREDLAEALSTEICRFAKTSPVYKGKLVRVSKRGLSSRTWKLRPMSPKDYEFVARQAMKRIRLPVNLSL